MLLGTCDDKCMMSIKYPSRCHR